MNREIEELSKKAAFLLHLWTEEYGFDDRPSLPGNIDFKKYEAATKLVWEHPRMEMLVSMTLDYIYQIQELAKATPEKE